MNQRYALYLSGSGVFILSLSHLFKIANIVAINSKRAKIEIAKKAPNSTAEAEKVLASDKSILDSVISDVILRAQSSSRMTTVSLVMIIILVVIGGSASIGTVAFNEFQNARELEQERGRFIKTAKLFRLYMDDQASGIIKRNLDMPFPGQFEARLDSVIKTFDTNKYDELLANTLQKKEISWGDLAMRVTIAALTLFLVQIFFHIYKYNQLQESHLFSKAEMMKLFNEQGSDKESLRKGMLEKTQPDVPFGKGPTSPTEKVIDALNAHK